LQGIARALNVFRGLQSTPTYTVVEPQNGVRQRMVRPGSVARDPLRS
jgi:hypothetical protein